MTYYLKPPEGKVLLRVIEDGVHTRMNLLTNINSQKPFETKGLKVEHLMENSFLDRISHFMLRISCLFSSEFKLFFIRTETKFFEERLLYYDCNDVRKMVSKLRRHLHETLPSRDFSDGSKNLFSEISHTCSELLKGRLLKHAFDKQHCGTCHEHFVIVNFQHCSSLVRRREVEVRLGKCHVHCGAWRKLLICFFHELLSQEVEYMARTSMLDIVNKDFRLKSGVLQMLEKFNKKYNFSSGKPNENNAITSNTVDMESEFFPPCALNILQNLRRDHRVGHHARIELSLFLKGIHMNVNEAITFWKDEYSKEPYCSEQGNSSCHHAWKNHNSRYIYNIQHLYGLRGSCKNYHSKSCVALQSAGGKIEVGCPFVTMNGKDLLKVLPRVVLDRRDNSYSSYKALIDEVLKFASEGNPTEACKACFAAHCLALENKLVLSSEQFKCKYNSKKNDCSKTNKSCLTREMETNSVCFPNVSKVINFNEEIIEKSDLSAKCSDETIRNAGVIQNELTVDTMLPSKESLAPTCFTDKVAILYPTQYYFDIKSNLLSKGQKCH